MKRIIVTGSPRSAGRSAHLAETLFEAHIDERPEDELYLVPVSEIEVGPCIACDACREPMDVILTGPDGTETRELRHRCVFDDDMQTIYDLLDDADELTVVAPVFFSGAPSMLKALLDRLQPYYWATQAAGSPDGGGKVRAKRPAELHVIGEGGDPHGYDALVSEVKSALAVAGFRLERIYDWVGKITPEGEIVAEAEEISLATGNAPRPRLDLSSGGKSPSKSSPTKGTPAKSTPAKGSPAKGAPAKSKSPSKSRPSNSKSAPKPKKANRRG